MTGTAGATTLARTSLPTMRVSAGPVEMSPRPDAGGISVITRVMSSDPYFETGAPRSGQPYWALLSDQSVYGVSIHYSVIPGTYPAPPMEEIYAQFDLWHGTYPSGGAGDPLGQVSMTDENIHQVSGTFADLSVDQWFEGIFNYLASDGHRIWLFGSKFDEGYAGGTAQRLWLITVADGAATSVTALGDVGAEFGSETDENFREIRFPFFNPVDGELYAYRQRTVSPGVTVNDLVRWDGGITFTSVFTLVSAGADITEQAVVAADGTYYTGGVLSGGKDLRHYSSGFGLLWDELLPNVGFLQARGNDVLGLRSASLQIYGALADPDADLLLYSTHYRYAENLVAGPVDIDEFAIVELLSGFSASQPLMLDDAAWTSTAINHTGASPVSSLRTDFYRWDLALAGEVVRQSTNADPISVRFVRLR